MFDARLRKVIDPPLEALGRRLARSGVTANGITWSGFVIGCGAWALLALASYPAALALILLTRLADRLDRAGARHAGPSDLGGHPATALDFLFFSAVVFFFPFRLPADPLPAAF